MDDMKAEKAVEKFEKGCNCSMAVFSVFAPDYGVEEGLALKIAAPFGGGMARMGETCGAVTGAFMALGLAFQPSPNESMDEMKERLYSFIKEFTQEFAKQYGSIKCREILGCDFSTPEGRKEFKERDLMHAVCARCVRTAVTLAGSLIAKTDQFH